MGPAHTGAVHSLVYSPQADKLLTGSADGTAKIFDAETGVCERVFTSRGKVLTAEFSPDERHVLVASSVHSDDGDTAEMFDAQTGTRLHSFGADPGTAPCSKGIDAAFSPKGDLVLVFKGRGDANCSCQTLAN